MNNLFCPSYPLSSSSPHLPLPFFPNLSPDYPSLLHTHHTLNNLLYQFTQPQTPATPKINTLNYNNRNKPYTQTHTRTTKQQTLHCFSQSPTPLPMSTFSATLSNSPQISISSIINGNPSNSYCL
jgi:hypothetical protein